MSVLDNIRWARTAPVVRRSDGRPDSVAHHVLLALTTFSDREGRARPSLATLADACTLTQRATSDALKRLCAAGLVKSDGEYRSTGVTVWVLVLGLSRSEVDADAMEQRRERARAKHVERQRRYRENRRATLSEKITGDAVERRHVTPSDDARDAVLDQHVTPFDSARDADETVTFPGPGFGSTSEGLVEEPRRTTASPAAKRERRTKSTEPRPDVDELCQRLADWMIRNGCKPPTIGDGWKTAARLLLDEDHRELPKALALIDWCQQDAFWQSNIQSMPKFRKQYDQLRLRANAEWEQRRTSSPASRGPYRDREDADYYGEI